MLFVACTVTGVMLLVCQITLSVLGLGESHDPWDEEIDSADESDREATCQRETVEVATVADQGEVSGKPPSTGIVSLRAVGTAITFFGLTGCAAEASRFETLPKFAIAFVCGFVASIGVTVLLRLSALQPYRTEMKNRLDDSQEQDVDR
jgi:hypothetical protein